MDSPAEILIILAVAAILLGPGRIPKLARSLGEAMHEFRSASSHGGTDDEAATAPAPATPATTPATTPDATGLEPVTPSDPDTGQAAVPDPASGLEPVTGSGQAMADPVAFVEGG